MELNVNIYRHYSIVTNNGRKSIMFYCRIQCGIFKIPVEVSKVIVTNEDTITIKMIELNDGYIILNISLNGEMERFGNKCLGNCLLTQIK